uniref:OBP6 n=1 Tax=Eupeodes corollae TaxID=290404 RepID=A0A8F9WKP0_9MUSC|nr:OBP6 [Eupeodes corollae]
MKTSIIVFLAFIAITSAEEWKLKTMEEWSQIHKTCDERFPVSAELIEKAKVEKYPPKEVFEVVLCILRGVEVWDDTKGFSTDRIMFGLENVAKRENLSKQFLRDGIEHCKDSNSEGSSTLDWAYRWFKCFKDNEPLFKAIREVKLYKERERKIQEE